MNIECDSDGNVDAPLNITSTKNDDACNPVVNATHNGACPLFSASEVTRFLLQKPYILSPILIIFGLMVTFLGRKFFPWTIAIVGCALGVLVTLLLFNMYQMLEK